ncbi:CubicO group peptidase, beta-lactamase class C family [Flagellimonas taeanensis]|uniref:CubicO group peptidase, beta-lactamase class C family n=1 Tax=Flagellimonas taeanensis TaxID=1005926 RepID=A0A1M6QM79_9FLAO|nr:serine hydrolase [Allomuricauda taeanensis]SFB71608.1 CubicO group peptidase, beta-lactamase class C family [Allomuricauda taeanensis]SHK21362.1 CubicO group peptidase, beta-lactamase class C family [Allomuricauda taeanensis]
MKKIIISFLFFVLCFHLGSAQHELIHALPSKLGLNETYIDQKVDSIMEMGIKNEAFPGAQVLVAKNDTIVFHKVYGFHTYNSIQPVALNDLYDLASVTKITGPLPALMKLVDESKLNLDVPFSTYWKPWRNQKDKKDLTLREILAHQAGLEPYIVFLQKVMRKGKLKSRFVQQSPSKKFKGQVYDTLYINHRFVRKMDRIINRSEVSDEKKYVYSGLTFLIFPRLIEQITGADYQTYLQDNFYGPLGCHTLGYLPSTKHYANAIVPTEVDTLFRKTLVKGWVHDENASLMGGVSGNAGLFGTADDLAKIMLFYQNYGAANGQQLISEATVKEFTTVQYPENENYRGLGFDKPLLNNAELPLEEAYPSPLASPESFGHSGFTGTFVWADPVKKLTFIFLSNRVYPNRDHRKLYSLDIRQALQDVFYKAGGIQPKN